MDSAYILHRRPFRDNRFIVDLLKERLGVEPNRNNLVTKSVIFSAYSKSIASCTQGSLYNLVSSRIKIMIVIGIQTVKMKI